MIRSLMERSTLYRTVSVPAAAWCGGLGLAAWGVHKIFATAMGTNGGIFLVLWLSVLVLAVAGNLFFLHREARRTGSPTFSTGFRTAARSLFPAFVCAGLLTLSGLWQVPIAATFLWMLFYGVGLLGTQHFAPRSIVVLGWFFIVTPFLLVFLSKHGRPDLFSDSWAYALMALTFGGYHLVYALIVSVLERGKRSTHSGEAPHGF